MFNNLAFIDKDKIDNVKMKDIKKLCNCTKKN